MADKIVMPSQKNAVLLAIQQSGLDPINFEWYTAPSQSTSNLRVSKLVYRETQYYYLFDFRDGAHYAIFSPGNGKLEETQFPGSWETQSYYFDKWLSYLKRELESPDLWTAVSNEKQLIAAGIRMQTDNETFSSEDQKRIADCLNELVKHLTETKSLTSSQLNLLQSQITYLINASGRMGKKDWLNLMIGTFMSTAVTLALQPEVARQIFRLIASSLSWLIGNQAILP